MDKESKLYDNATEIAEIAVDIGAIKLQPDNPFTWASGYRMPIYNDNRMLLGESYQRYLVTRALEDITVARNLEFTMIAGTVTAGIAPAASLSQYFGVPLVLLIDGEPHVHAYAHDMQVYEQQAHLKGARTLIASTCPFAIHAGVHLANSTHLPFAYVREKKKGHGMQQQVEGIVTDNDVATLVTRGGSDYTDHAITALREEGAKEVTPIVIGNYPAQQSIAGQRILMVEDLVSMGGSAVNEIQAYRELGAIVDDCVSIFSYDLDDSKKAFADARCGLHPILTYPALLEAMKGTLEPAQLEILSRWRENPKAWGEAHGFPKVEK